MTTAQHQIPDYTSDAAATYKAKIDGNAAVVARIASAYQAYSASSPDMTVKVAAGALLVAGAVVENAIQTTGTITAPGSNSRIDRVVIDATTGVVSVITGVSGASPSAPALTAGKLPVAQVLLTSASTAITNSMITDERVAAIPSNVTAVCAAVRQTVSSGPTDSNGLPNLGGSTGSATVTTSNISSTAPLAVAAAYGFDNASGKALDYFGFSTSNLSWTGLSTVGTMYLYVDVNTTTGALTTGSTTLAPTYQWGGTYSTTNLQNTYNIQDGQMKVGNGSTAAAVARVFVGQVTVGGGSTVTAITWYAYNGRYRSPTTATLPAALVHTAFNHNLGIPPEQTGDATGWAICTTADNGFAVGTVLRLLNYAGGSAIPGQTTYKTTRNSATLYAGYSSTGWVCNDVSTGGIVAMTAASWSYWLTIGREW